MTDREKNLKGNIDAPVSWCVLPWSHVSIKGNGTFRLCCHSAASENRGTITDTSGDALHISSSSWDDAINSEMMNTIRLKMLNGEWPDDCIRCKREFESGMKSRNVYEQSVLADIIEPENYPSFEKAKALTSPDGTIKNEDFPVSFLDIRFGNLCNLKCNMCSPTDSNQWYDDYNKVWGYDNFWDSGKKIQLQKNSKGKLEPVNDVFNWYADQHLWSEIEKHIAEFRRIYIVGGEPLLIDAHYDFLQKCIDEGHATNLTIEYNSNITNIPKRAWDIWKHFNKILIGVSIDGFGEVNDLIRFPSKWTKIEQNIRRFSVDTDNIDIHISPSIQIMNSWHLPEFIEYMLTSNYKNVSPWGDIMSPHPVHRPAYLNLNILPDNFKVELCERFTEYKNKFNTTDYQSLYGDSNDSTWVKKVSHACSILDRYAEFMYTTEYDSKELIKWRSNFIHFMDTLDELRKTDWKKVCPEIYQATMEWRKLPTGIF